MVDADEHALIGRRIAGKFVVEKRLGGGAMGAVYRARDASLERLVALKVMHPSIAIDPSFVTRFHREARAASRLDHPSSMRVIEFGEEPDGLLFIAMEYLEGRDLYKVIHEDWPLSETRISDIMMKALSALTMAHEMGVIHRDLKPENIMILDRKDDEGHDIVKVCDFGIAKITEKDDEPGGPPKGAGRKLTTAGLVVGTPEYMSPEQARGEKLDARSDLYSMSVLLYQLLTGRTPFLGETALSVVLKHISEAPEPPHVIYAEVHKGLEAVCMKGLAKSPDERYPSARDMRAAIKAAIEGRPLPLDVSAETMVDPRTLGAASAGAVPSAPAATTGSSRPPQPAYPSSQTQPLPSSANQPVARNAPIGLSSPSESKVTPLGTSVSSPADERSRWPRVVGVALAALVGGGGVGYVAMGRTSKPRTVEARPLATPTASEAAVPDPKPTSTPSTAPVPSLEPDAPKAIPDPVRRAPPAATVRAAPTEARSAAAPMSAAPVDPPAPPPPLDPPPAPPPTTTPAPAPAPVAVFRPTTCRASLGAQRSTSGYSAKDLSLRGTESAWTGCARSSIREKPSAPIAGAVKIHFGDNKAFKSATCAGCPPLLAQCIATMTRPTVAVQFKSGDATGEPEFEVPVTFTCD